MRSRKPKLIGFGGKAGSGKSESAIYLRDKYNFVRLSFATPIKRAVTALGCYVNPLYSVGTTKEEKEVPRKEFGGLTDRDMLQSIGDALRAQNSDFFVDVMYPIINQTMNKGYSVVVDDVRFPNEVAMLKACDAKLLFVERPDVLAYNDHVSENSVDPEMFDEFVLNHFELEDLYKTLEDHIDD
ncbi:MAG: hypothetical protein HRT61_01080 [Ekhidna sp.]|nr:hypothetical protein [Ekhidna sp.]